MKNAILIGESGGSKTDWVLLRNTGEQMKASSPSLHPTNWSKYNWEELTSIWKKMRVDFEQTNLHFYGAGCNSEDRQKQAESVFSKFPFLAINIYCDLKAAGLASLGKSDGYVAILGSGSVLIDFKSEDVSRYYGGLGRAEGDEGSGYYFGKLVTEAFKVGEVKPIQSALFKACFKDSEISDILNGKTSDEMLLKIAFLLSDRLFEFQDFHKRNFQLFFDKYVNENVPSQSQLNFVGSYAYYHSAILREICNKNNFGFGRMVERPIEQLTEFYIKKYL